MATEKMESKTNECNNILKCESLHRIIGALHFYQSMKDDPENMKQIDKLTIEYFEKYKDFINDYGHLLKIHINGGDTKQNNEQFQKIHEYVSKHIKCDIKTCQQYIRNNRNRGDKAQRNNNDDNHFQLSNDRKALFYIDQLDSIHCYLYHAFDTGFRIKQNEIEIEDNQSQSISWKHQNKIERNNEEMDESLYTDNQMEKLKIFLGNKRKQLDEIGGLHRVKNSKFMTTITGIYSSIFFPKFISFTLRCFVERRTCKSR